jgi:hypothetical protein
LTGLQGRKKQTQIKPISDRPPTQQQDVAKILACAGRNELHGVHIDYGGSNGHNVATLSFSSTKESSECLVKDLRRQK